MRRLLAVLGLTVLITGGGQAVSAPVQAAACTGSSGVTVVVQAGSSADVRCAPGDPSSAGAALQAAGFAITRVAPPNAGAVCQIDGVPQTSCVRMPPTSRYWAFFHASAGGSWTYANSGIFAYDPSPGSVVGFRLGSGAAPGVAPPKPSAPKPTSTPTAPRPSSSTTPRPTSSSRPSSSPRQGSSAAPTTSHLPKEMRTRASQRSATAGEAPTAAGTTGASPRSSTAKSRQEQKAAKATAAQQEKAKQERAKRSSTSPRTGDGETPNPLPPQASSSSDITAAGATDDDSGSGSALLPTAIGGGLLVALGGGALVMARRRGL